MRTDAEADRIAEEGTQIYHELHNVIRRYMDESPNLTLYEIIGALDMVKQDVRDHHKTTGKP